MAAKVNLRKKHLDSICTKIATFIVSETYTDEGDIQGILSQAIELLDQAAAKCVENDNVAQTAAAALEPAVKAVPS